MWLQLNLISSPASSQESHLYTLNLWLTCFNVLYVLRFTESVHKHVLITFNLNWMCNVFNLMPECTCTVDFNDGCREYTFKLFLVTLNKWIKKWGCIFFLLLTMCVCVCVLCSKAWTHVNGEVVAVTEQRGQECAALILQRYRNASADLIWFTWIAPGSSVHIENPGTG